MNVIKTEFATRASEELILSLVDAGILVVEDDGVHVRDDYEQ